MKIAFSSLRSITVGVAFLFSVLQAQSSDKAKKYFDQGRILYSKTTRENYEKAVEQYRKAISEDSNYANAYAGLGETYALLAVETEKAGGDAKSIYQKAISSSAKAILKNPNSPIAHRALAQALFNFDSKTNGQKIHDELLRALSLDSLDAETYYLLWLHTENDKPESPLIRTTIRLNPDLFQARYALGVVYSKQKIFDKAITEYIACIRINPKNYRGYYSLGNAYSQQSKFDLAAPEYEKAIDLNEQLADTYFYCGVAYSRIKKNSEARKKFDKYLALAPNGAYAVRAQAMLLEVKE